MINKHKSNKIKENSNTMRHLNNGTDHRHSKSCCDQSSPTRRTMTSHGTLYRIWRPYWMAVKLEVGIWLQKNKPQSKLCQLQLFLRWWRHDYVMLGLWKFSDFCSRHTVGVAGDAIMYHILVITRDSEGDNIFVLCVCLCVCVFVRMI